MAEFGCSSAATSVILLVIAGATMIYGVQMTRFEVAAFAGADVPTATAAAFSDFVGLRGRARRALAPENAVEIASREEIENVLVVEPSDGFYWVALAENLQDGGGARDKMLSALHMSEVVQPHEAATMERRAILILSLWEDMPESDRWLASGQLAELGFRAPTDVRATILRIIGSKSESVRAGIRGHILERAGDDSSLPTFLGL